MSIEESVSNIEKKVDTLRDKVDELHITVVLHQVEIQEHLDRTKKIEETLEPIKEKHQQLIGIGKLVGFLGVIASIIGVVLKLLTKQP